MIGMFAAVERYVKVDHAGILNKNIRRGEGLCPKEITEQVPRVRQLTECVLSSEESTALLGG